MWQPFIGKAYEPHRVLLLGESCYDWIDPETMEMRYPQPDHPSWTVRKAVRIQGKTWDITKTMKTLSRAVSNNPWPSAEQVVAGWDRVAFTNYIPVTAGYGVTASKTKRMWLQAMEEWPELLATLNPNVVIVLGHTMWDCLPPAQLSLSADVRGYSLPQGGMAMCHKHLHPSRGPGWESYAEAINEAFLAVDQEASRGQASSS